MILIFDNMQMKTKRSKRHSSLSSPLKQVITALAEKAFNETAQSRVKVPTK